MQVSLSESVDKVLSHQFCLVKLLFPKVMYLVPSNQHLIENKICHNTIWRAQQTTPKKHSLSKTENMES